MIAYNLKIPAHRAVEMSSEVRAIRREASPQGGSKGKQAILYYDKAKSKGINQIPQNHNNVYIFLFPINKFMFLLLKNKNKKICLVHKYVFKNLFCKQVRG